MLSYSLPMFMVSSLLLHCKACGDFITALSVNIYDDISPCVCNLYRGSSFVRAHPRAGQAAPGYNGTNAGRYEVSTSAALLLQRSGRGRMFECDQCKRWFHQACLSRAVGMSDWLCSSCR